MSNRIHPRRLRRAGIAVAAVLALAIIPAAAQAAPVNLATAGPFVVLGGAAVTNTGPSVLKGGLGVAPGTSLTGFAAPATVLGAVHQNDAVASQAQADLTNAFGVAGGQAVPPGNELTGIDLGGLTLTAGAYRYSSSAQLTGQLTLDAQGDPNAQFVFIVGSTLTTASVSSVNLINGASPCNVYWRIGSSATFGTGTQFQGNVLAHVDISVNNAVHVDGRLLAAGTITLINDVLDNSKCETSTGTGTTGTETTSPTTTPVGGSSGSGSTTTPTGGSGGTNKKGGQNSNGSSTVTHGPQGPNGTVIKVTGKGIKKIVVTVDNHMVKTVRAPSLKTTVNGTPGIHKVTVRVNYKDKTPPKITSFHINVPTPAPLQPRSGPSQFTG